MEHLSIYGDESVNNNIVCYAICVFPQGIVKIGENLIKLIKNEFDIPEDYFLHCKELFHGCERGKLDFDIQLEDVKNLYRKIAYEFKAVNMICCYADKRGFKKEEVIDWGNGHKTKMYYGDKELIHLCKNGAMVEIVRNRKENEYDFFPDPDKNGRMRWNNKKKAKVNNPDYNLIIPEGILGYQKEGTELTRARETKSLKAKPALIQIADFLAYSFAKAKTIQVFRDKDFFIEMIEILNPEIRGFAQNKNLS